MQKNIVAIIGRTNVGKSTLFNKIIGKRVSIVDDSYGVTRDRIYRLARWQNQEFYLIDTGGLEIKNSISFQEEIKIQVEIALKEANIIIFVIDGRTGVTAEDEYVANLLHKSKKIVVVAANKLENKKLDSSLYAIGFETIFPISALHGAGIADLLDWIFTKLEPKEKLTDNLNLKITIIGKPNVGKSSLLNALVNENRSIVSPIAGTTRDSINALLKIGDCEYEIIDTAGLLRKSRLIESVEHYALMRAMDSLIEGDIALIIFDANEEFSHFHARIIGHAFELNKPIIIVVNKWDLIKKETMTMQDYVDKIRKEFQFVPWAQIVFLSALTKLRLNTLIDAIINLTSSLEKKIKKVDLNAAIIEWQILKPPPNFKNGRLKITYAKQSENSKVPTFIFYVNDPLLLHFSYKRYLENRLREYFGFNFVPVILIFKKT